MDTLPQTEIRRGAFWEIETPEGAVWFPAETEHVPEDLLAQEDVTADAVSLREGRWGARGPAPDDGTENLWSVFACRDEACQYLSSTFDIPRCHLCGILIDAVTAAEYEKKSRGGHPSECAACIEEDWDGGFEFLSWGEPTWIAWLDVPHGGPRFCLCLYEVEEYGVSTGSYKVAYELRRMTPDHGFQRLLECPDNEDALVKVPGARGRVSAAYVLKAMAAKPAVSPEEHEFRAYAEDLLREAIAFYGAPSQ